MTAEQDERRRANARRRKHEQRERDEKLRAEGRTEVRPISTATPDATPRGGRILGVLGVPTSGAVALGHSDVEVHYSRDRSRTSSGPSYREWLHAEREPEPNPAVLVLHDAARLSFFPDDRDDIDRIARLAAEELDLDGPEEMQLRETLSRIEPGRVFTLSS